MICAQHFNLKKLQCSWTLSAGIKTLVDNAPFEVGVSDLPVPKEEDRQGVAIGGASLWMSKGISDETSKAAWDFMKYLATPEVQAKWHVESGYFAVNPKAYDQEIAEKRVGENILN